MLVQKTVTTNTNFAGRLSEGMLQKTLRDSKSHIPDFLPRSEMSLANKKAGVLSSGLQASRRNHLQQSRTLYLWYDAICVNQMSVLLPFPSLPMYSLADQKVKPSESSTVEL